MSAAENAARGEAFRFMVAGGINTLFGLLDVFGLTWLFVHGMPVHAAVATTLATGVASVVNITFSFLVLKHFVFRTRGNYVSEYLRSFAVYLPSALLSLVAVGPLAAVYAHWLPNARLAPYAAQATIVAVAIVPQFLGHKKITFRRKDTSA